MNLESSTSPKSPWRNPLLYTSAILAGAALYVAYILYSRYDSNRRYEQQNRQQQNEQRHEDDVRAVEQLGGSDLAIRGLYVSPSVISAGQSAQLCYDVANAKTVALDPPVASVWPSHSRCIDLAPRKTTVYKLSITGANGDVVSQTVELRVR
jgi:hypothetical protein